MDKSWVRKSFYINPPQKNATNEEWEQWLEADAKEARADKVRFSRSRKSQQVEQTSDFNVVKVRGVYRQVPALGYVGGEDDAIGRLEPIVEAAQEKQIDLARQSDSVTHRRGGNRKYRNKAKREKIRLERKAKYRNR